MHPSIFVGVPPLDQWTSSIDEGGISSASPLKWLCGEARRVATFSATPWTGNREEPGSRSPRQARKDASNVEIPRIQTSTDPAPSGTLGHSDSNLAHQVTIISGETQEPGGGVNAPIRGVKST